MVTFASRLNALGWSQTHYRRVIRDLSGKARSDVTTSRWATGQAQPPAEALAILELFRRMSPRELAKLSGELDAE